MSSKRKSILKYLKSAGSATANKIAQNALNLKKGTGSSKALIDEMVADGELVEDSSGKYTEYTVAGKTKKTKKASIGKTSSVKKARAKGAARKIEQAKQKKAKEKGFNSKTLSGYDAYPNDDGTVTVTGPNNQSAVLADNEHLVVINGKFLYAAKTPPEVIGAISEYTKGEGMTTFTVTDMVTNEEIGTGEDIELDDSRIICLEIKKHNKAA
jgi:hypothetical protein